MTTVVIIGLVTGAFLGGFPLKLGLTGAILGGISGAIILFSLSLFFKFRKLDRANTIVKYASIGILPGMLIGGSKILGLGATGALILGAISSVIYATVIYKLLNRHEKSERYVSFKGDYIVLFLLGSISVFITILVLDFLGNILDFEALILKLPYTLTMSLVGFVALCVYLLSLIGKKRKLKTWSDAFKANHLLLASLGGTLILILTITLITRQGYIPLNTIIFIAAGIVIPYAIGLILPLSLGYLLARNTNRPVMGAVFSIIGSIFVMVIGISVAPMLLLPGSGLMWAGLITGLFMLMFALSVLFKPESHFFAGCAIIVMSILSFLGAAGGLIIGGLLGLVGGVLIASWAGLEKTVDHDPNTGQSKGSTDISITPSDTVSS